MPAAHRSKLLAPAAIVSLLILLLGAAGLFALHYSNTQAADGIARLDAVNRAHLGAAHARASFKTQVQEWKNILLRGSNPEDLTTYRARFEQEEATVRAQLQTLARDIPASVFGSTAGPDVSDLPQAHERLGQLYRKALLEFDPADPLSAARVDPIVRGADRQLSDDLDTLAAGCEQRVVTEIRAVADHAATRYQSMRRLVLVTVGAAILAALWLVYTAVRS